MSSTRSLKYMLLALALLVAFLFSNVIYWTSHDSFKPLEAEIESTLSYLNKVIVQSVNISMDFFDNEMIQLDAQDTAVVPTSSNKSPLGDNDETQLSILNKGDSGVSVELLQTVDQFWEKTSLNQTMCASWDVNVDDWWLPHPDWYPSFESHSHYCFSPMQDAAKADFMRQLYQNQYHGNCSNAVYKKVISWGWGMDFLNVIDTLLYGLNHSRPARMIASHPWHYALPNTPKGLGVVEPELVCESGDMDCFFLPLSPCPPWNKTFKMEKGDLYEKGVLRKRGRMYRQIAYWLLDYAKRPLHWLRKRVHDFVANQTVTPPCTTMHVRRGDITLDKGRRRFYPIEDYVKAAPNIHDTVFLVTDDANAIGEAKYKFPNITWQYIDRPRYRGSEAGFKKHTPSGDGAFEVTVLMSLSRLVKRCDQFVYGKSGFADFLWNEMLADGSTREEFTVKEDHKFGTSLEDLRKSVNISQSFNVST